MEASKLLLRFEQQYGASPAPVRFFHAPGRVNLIGEHIDYNGGYVLPAALEFGTTLLIRKREDQCMRLATTNFEYQLDIDVNAFADAKQDQWTDYPIGVMNQLQQSDCGLTKGYELLFHGDIPNGAGLSSSASLEVVTAYALLAMEGHRIDRTDIAVMSQRAENQFVGVNCGIMDQFAVSHGKLDHAILLMCDTLEYTHVPFQTDGYCLIIGNTNKRRGLVDSKYNERRAQCEEAVCALQAAYPHMTLLAQLTTEQFKTAADKIADDTVRARAAHVIAENDRVKQSVEALKHNDLIRFGELMNASHDSLRDLYEVSCKELDIMVKEARSIEGTLGSRMTGAGFGGCTVSLVREDAAEQFVAQVGAAYEQQTGLHPEFYICRVGDGVRELAPFPETATIGKEG